MNPAIEVEVDVAAVRGMLDALGSDQLPNTAQAVADGTQLIQREWMQAASGVEVRFQGRGFMVRRVSGAYVRSISDGLEYPVDGDALSGRVTARTPYASTIEEGSPAHDMKPGLLGGPRARMGKDGKRFVIVPFRHNTPGATATGKPMPAEVYKDARKLAFSRVTGTRQERNAKGDMVQRYTYSWGGQASTMQGWRSRIFPTEHPYTHKHSIYSGMVRMGSSKQSSFMTFRIVSDNSPANSWWSPAIEPRPISQAVAEATSERVVAIVRAGFEMDLMTVAGGG